MWGDKQNLGYGGLVKGTGKVVGMVLLSKGKTFILWRKNGQEYKKEFHIKDKIPGNKSGRVVINILQNDNIEIKFDKK